MDIRSFSDSDKSPNINSGEGADATGAMCSKVKHLYRHRQLGQGRVVRRSEGRGVDLWPRLLGCGFADVVIHRSVTLVLRDVDLGQAGPFPSQPLVCPQSAPAVSPQSAPQSAPGVYVRKRRETASNHLIILMCCE